MVHMKPDDKISRWPPPTPACGDILKIRKNILIPAEYSF